MSALNALAQNSRMRVFTKSSLALHQVIVHHSQDTNVAGPVVVLCKVEVEPRLQPVLVKRRLSVITFTEAMVEFQQRRRGSWGVLELRFGAFMCK